LFLRSKTMRAQVRTKQIVRWYFFINIFEYGFFELPLRKLLRIFEFAWVYFHIRRRQNSRFENYLHSHFITYGAGKL
jgi:hypothetical protein